MAELNITANGNTLVEGINRQQTFSVAVSGTLDGTIKIQYPTSDKVPASLTTSLSGGDNDLVFTAKNPGVDGNSLTVKYTDPLESGQALSLDFTYPDLDINLATDQGDAAAALMESAGSDNNVLITADNEGIGGNDFSVEFIDPSENDAILSVTTSDYKLFTVNLGTGSGGAINSSANDIVAALNAYIPFAAILTASAPEGTGESPVDAIAETDLTGGGDNYSIISTSQEIADLVNGNRIVSGHLTASNANSNDGTGEVTALSKTNLTGGTNGTFADYKSGETGNFTEAGERVFVNVGSQPRINVNASGITTTDATVVISSGRA